MPQAKKPTARDKTVAKRRRTILEAAVMCFVETGYHQSGVREIAKRAGVSLGNLYNHFASKTDMLAEIAAIERTELAPFLDLLKTDGPVLEVLETFLAEYTKHLSDPVTVILGLEITSEAIRQPNIAELFDQSRNSVIDALCQLLERGVEDGSLRKISDVRETAYIILQITEGTAFRHGIEQVSLERLLESQRHFVVAAISA